MQTLESTRSRSQSWLSWFFRGILVLALIILLTRLSELQIIKGAYYRDLAENNRIKKIPIIAPRGKIYTSDGKLLADNQPQKYFVDFDQEEGLVKTEVNDKDVPDSEVITEYNRVYPMGSLMAHLTGYLGEVNEDEVGKIDEDCPGKGDRSLGSMIGRGGLEQYYDCKLRGADGEQLIEVNTLGEKIRILGQRQPVPGMDIHTNIDSKLQSKVAEIVENRSGIDKKFLTDLGELKGAIVVSKPKGEIMSLYSFPAYDPANIADYLTDEDLPLFNRAIGGAYHPGSIFKLVTAIGALEVGAIDTDYEYEDTGVINIDEYSYTNWYFTQYGGREGLIGLKRAIARSTDTYFYKVGELMGIDNLAHWAREFGLDKETGIDLPGEIHGLVPDPDWKKRVIGERWFLGNTYHVAIGQGDLTATPVEMNTLTNVFANGGYLCEPRINSDLEEKCIHLDISPDYIDEIVEGMKQVCSDGGTAYPFFGFIPQAACKTGTAETFENDKTHAWFTVMAPADNPEIVVTVLIEKGGEGSQVAAPLAFNILNWYFHENH